LRNQGKKRRITNPSYPTNREDRTQVGRIGNPSHERLIKVVEKSGKKRDGLPIRPTLPTQHHEDRTQALVSAVTLAVCIVTSFLEVAITTGKMLTAEVEMVPRRIVKLPRSFFPDVRIVESSPDEPMLSVEPGSMKASALNRSLPPTPIAVKLAALSTERGDHTEAQRLWSDVLSRDKRNNAHYS
jgi:hypothetical protein